MARRSSTTTQPPALVASAARIRLRRGGNGEGAPKTRQSWQTDALALRRQVPEIGMSVRFVASAMSKLQLYVGYWPDDSRHGSPIPIDAEDSEVPESVRAAANAELARLRNGQPTHTQLLWRMGANLDIVGEVYLVGIEADEDTGRAESWTARSISEVTFADGERVVVKDLPGDTGTQLREGLDTAIRIWVPDDEYGRLAYAPMAHLVDVAATLRVLNQQIMAEASSRLSAGVLMVARSIAGAAPVTGADGEPGADPFIDKLMETFVTPVEDSASAASIMPAVVRVPDELVEKGMRHLLLGRQPDEKLDERIAARIQQIARGIDLPVEVVLGHQGTTFANAEQVDQDTYEDHLDHRARMMVSGLTVGFLTPNLLENPAVPDDWAERLVVWFDPSALIAQPDVEKNADSGHDKLAISDAAWRRAKGFTDADAPDEVELLRRLLIDKGIFTGDLTNALMRVVLGVADGVQLPYYDRPPAPPGELPEGVSATTIEDSAAQQLGLAPAGGQAQAQPPALAAVEPPPAEAPPPADGGAPVASTAPQAPPPGGAVTTAAAGVQVLPPGRPSRLGQTLVDIDRDLTTRITVAAHAAVERALERAGARIRAKAGSMRAAVRTVTNRYAAAQVGPSLLAEAGFTNDQLLAGSFDDLEQAFRAWGAQAQADAIDAVSRAVGGFSSAERAALKLRQATDLGEAWGWFRQTLGVLTEAKLFDPDGGQPAVGEWDSSLNVPAGAVRNAIARMGGAANVHSATGDDAWVAIPGQGGVGTGEVVIDAYKAKGGRIEAYQWTYGPSMRSRPFEPHVALDGLVFRDFLDPGLENVAAWPETSHFWPGDHKGCRCFPAGTVVSGPAAAGATRRWYTGELVKIVTASGYELTGTPNHPVLTPHGWVPLGMLHQGAEVVSQRSAGLIPGRLAPDDAQQPALIEQVFGTLNSAGGRSAVTVPGSPMDFHGDGADGQVDVVRTGRLLHDRGETSRNEQAVDGDLKPGSELAMAFARGGSLGPARRVGVPSPAARLGGSERRDPPLRGPHFDRATDRDTSGAETLADGATVDAVLAGERQLALPSDVARNDRGVGQLAPGLGASDPSGRGPATASVAAVGQLGVEPTHADVVPGADRLGPFASQVGRDRVVHVSRIHDGAGCHVFNLSTEGGWYFANGIVVHNCDFTPITLDPPSGGTTESGITDEPAADETGAAPASTVPPGLGKPSDMVEYADAKARKFAEATMDALDRVHGVEQLGLERVQIVRGGKTQNLGGYFSTADKDPKPSRKKFGTDVESYRAAYRAWLQDKGRMRIRVNDRGDGADLMSLLHELGHRWDYNGRGLRFRTPTPDMRGTAEMAQLLKAVTQTETYSGAMERYRRGGYKFVGYYQSPHEVWARAYSQWAANYLGGPWRESLVAMRTPKPGHDHTYQWSDEEFTALAPLVENVLRAWGMMR